MSGGFDTSVLWALGSLAFAGANDLAFKRQGSRGRGHGQYLAVVGAVWAGVFAVRAVVLGQWPVTGPAVGWGLAAGIFSAAANYLLIVSFRRLDASVGATVYRLNMVVAAVLAILFLGERGSPSKTAGLALAAGAVFLLAEPAGEGVKRRVPGWGLLLAGLACLLRAAMGLSYKLAAERFAVLIAEGCPAQEGWFLSIQGLVWVAVGLAGGARWEPGCRLDRTGLGYAVFSGALCCGIVFFLARGLAVGQASVVIPISQMSFVMTALLARLIGLERLSPRRLAAIAAAVAAVVLIGRSAR